MHLEHKKPRLPGFRLPTGPRRVHSPRITLPLVLARTPFWGTFFKGCKAGGTCQDDPDGCFWAAQVAVAVLDHELPQPGQWL